MKINENKINELIQKYELETGSELTVVVTDKSDPYPAATLRGSLFTSLLTTLLISSYFHFTFEIGLLFILIFISFFHLVIKRTNLDYFFVTQVEKDRESLEKAKELFLEKAILKTQHRLNSFIFMSIFERKIYILVDQNLKQKVSDSELKEIINSCPSILNETDKTLALEHVVTSLHNLMLKKNGGKILTTLPLVLENKVLILNSKASTL